MFTQSRSIVLLTRAKTQSERFANGFCADNAEFIIAPLMQIERINADFPPHDGDFVLTSENAVMTLPDIYHGTGRRAYCVGKRTALAAGTVGFDAVSADGNAHDLHDLIVKTHKNKNLLHLSGEHLANDTLTDIPGLQRIVTYKQTALPADPKVQKLLSGEAPVIVPLFSPRSARLFFSAYPEITAPIHVVAISAATAETVANRAATKIGIAARPDADNMKKMVADLI
ncbi:uroporphyrinogen-III synthase [Halocynthiibacter sp.]|uniref:uroporphyrinogen-III synthase n=1 Tax=Halocynthiibacter sp. TaxID=1979210 RepID=UPI003C3344D1